MIVIRRTHMEQIMSWLPLRGATEVHLRGTPAVTTKNYTLWPCFPLTTLLICRMVLSLVFLADTGSHPDRSPTESHRAHASCPSQTHFPTPCHLPPGHRRKRLSDNKKEVRHHPREILLCDSVLRNDHRSLFRGSVLTKGLRPL